MADIFPVVWASDETADIDVPSAAQMAVGFQCGKASPGIFNWLFQNLMATINELNLGDFISKFRRIDTSEGIQGGGALDTDRTLRLNIPGLEDKGTAANEDLIAVYDPVSGMHRKMTRAVFSSGFGGGGGAVTGGANIGTGPGTVYVGVSGTNLQFRNLLNAGGITIANSGNNVTFALADMGSELTYQ